MKRLVRRAYSVSVMLGFDPLQTVRALRGLPAFFRDLKNLKRQSEASNKEFPMGKLYPCLTDRFTEGGSASGHYFHQDLLVARRICINNPQRHVDVGSRIDGFVAHVASFRQIEVIDIRPISSNVTNVVFKQADMMAPVPESLKGYCDSLSCLHALEHFGLGRYGDPVSYGGYLLGLEALYQLLKKGGKLYLSVPIGSQRIEFNAHRVFSIEYLLECFKDKYAIDMFSYVGDDGDLRENIALAKPDVDRNFGCTFGCGIFELTKL